MSTAATTPLRVLLLEDDENDALLVIRELERGGVAPVVERVCTAQGMQAALEHSGFDVILSDFTMPGFDALGALRIVKASGKDVPFIVVSGTIGEEIAVQAMKAGAQDYFSKTSLGRLPTAIAREMREASVRRERGEALASKHATEEQLRLVVDSVKEYAIYGLDRAGRVASWHLGAERAYGYSEAAVLGQPFAGFFSRDDVAQGTPSQILAQVALGESHEGEFLQVCKDGSMFWADATVAPLRDEVGRLRGASVVVRDVTDKVKLLEELRAALRSRDEFLSMASHELRTPVTTLRLQLQTLRRALDRANEDVPRLLRERLGNLERQTGRISVLVGELLDLSRMRLGRLQLNRERFDLVRVVRETVERLHDQIARAGCEVSLHGEEQSIVGSWDHLRIEQVLVNLIVNAAKFGAGKPIAVSVDADDLRARVTVEDHGIGIAPEDQARIFDRFERAVSAENYGGLGLGLFIARQIVEAHGGMITVRSAPGAGAAFTVEVPRIPGDAAGRGPRGSNLETGTSEPLSPP